MSFDGDGANSERQPRARDDRIASRAGKESRLASAEVVRDPTGEYHPKTLEYLTRAALDHRKGLGQYFTPRSVRERLLDLLPEREFRRVLDPACGTGEFLRSVGERFPSASVEGWEIDVPLVEVAREVAPDASVLLRDGTGPRDGVEPFDLVVGNPPYFEFKAAGETRARFADVISGRPNIFSFFLSAGLSLLRDRGILAFVVPQSMSNGAYFKALRASILSRARIVALVPIEETGVFFDAQQTVMLLVLEKGGRSDDFVFRRSGIEIFSPDTRALASAFEGKTTLAELGFTVKTGRVVWNQWKEALTDDPSGAEPLLWAHNIGEDGLRFPAEHPTRAQYVNRGSPDVGPAILVNRITGASSRATIRSAVVPDGMTFFAENHVNVAFPPSRGGGDLFQRPQSAHSLESVARQISSEGATAAIRMVTGNTQVSAKELLHLVPLAL